MMQRPTVEASSLSFFEDRSRQAAGKKVTRS
nr:MAG TPA: hypothetical protein [Caudoviricetes sp.]